MSTGEKIRIQNLIKNAEQELKTKYEELGKRTYSNNSIDPPKLLKPLYSEIAQLREDLSRFKDALISLDLEVRCSHCGSKLKNESKFCWYCGKEVVKGKVKKICHNCGTLLEDDGKFCHNCGQIAE